MISDPIFLSVAEIAEIHEYQIANFGGTPGLRDVGMLKSAVAMPSATFGGTFLHSTVGEMAAAYLFHLCENHPFIDGNKRMGAMAALVFLDLNGYDCAVDDRDLTAMVLQVAEGKMPKSEIARFFRLHVKR